MYTNLKEWFENLVTPSKTHPKWYEINTHIVKYSDDRVQFQFCGVELILLPNGKYILTDTTGG